MPNISMPDGTQVAFPDNPTQDDIDTMNKMSNHMTWLQQQRQEDQRVLKALPTATGFQKFATQGSLGVEKAWEGLKQVLPQSVSNTLGLQVRSPEEMKEKEAYWNQAAQMGGGGKWTQGAGQALPGMATMAIPGLGEAGLATQIGAGALTGGLQGYTQPVTGPGQRTTNTIVGTGLGAAGGALPGVIKQGANLLNPTRYAGQAGADAISKAGGDVNAVVQQLRNTPAQTFTGTAPTAAAATQDAGLAAAEAASRANPKVGPGWNAADTTANNARLNAFNQAVGDPVAARAAAVTARNNATTAIRNQALTEIDNQSANMARGLGKDVQAQMKGIQAQPGNREGQQILDDINATLQKGNVKAADVARMRDSLGNATQADPAIAQAKDAIDSVLSARSNVSGQGKLWDNYLDIHQQMSKPVNEADALIKIKSTFVDPHTGMTVGNQVTPDISAGKLADALRVHNAPDVYGNQPLSQNTYRSLSDIVDEARQANIYQGKAPINPAASNATADIAKQAAPAIVGGTLGTIAGGGPLGGVIGAGLGYGAQVARKAIKGAQASALANALRNPQTLADAIELSQKFPTGTLGRASIDALRSGAITGAGNATRR